MKLKFAPLFSAVAAATVCASALAGDHRDRDDVANRIVGLWATEGHVGACGSAPTITVFNTLLFHANGTLFELVRIPPNGIPNPAGTYQRTDGIGTWTYDARQRKYFIHLRFDRYINNLFNGSSTVDREITLSRGATIATGVVRSGNYDVAGQLLTEVCGEATSTRL